MKTIDEIKNHLYDQKLLKASQQEIADNIAKNNYFNNFQLYESKYLDKYPYCKGTTFLDADDLFMHKRLKSIPRTTRLIFNLR